jgi:hypothetical protein
MNYNECRDFQIFFVGLHNELYMDMYNMKYWNLKQKFSIIWFIFNLFYWQKLVHMCLSELNYIDSYF